VLRPHRVNVWRSCQEENAGSRLCGQNTANLMAPTHPTALARPELARRGARWRRPARVGKVQNDDQVTGRLR